jgi:hypothetical protein
MKVTAETAPHYFILTGKAVLTLVGGRIVFEAGKC